VLALSGRRSEASALLAELQTTPRPRPPSHYELAFVQAALGDHDAALASLQSARAAHETELVYLDVDPLFDEMRAEPGFSAPLAGVRSAR
jgi:hypothetical protein